MNKNSSAVDKNWKNNTFPVQRALKYALVMMFVFHALPIVAEAGLKEGEKLYMQNCAVCHGEDGEGAMAGVNDLNQNSVWVSQPDAALLEKLKQGINKEGAVSMPPKGGNAELTDQELMEIIKFMHKQFGKK